MKKAITAIYYTLMVILLARVILSWVPNGYGNPFGSIIFLITEPVLSPIRSLLPQVGFDLSVLIVWLVLRFAYGFLMSRCPEQRN